MFQNYFCGLNWLARYFCPPPFFFKIDATSLKGTEHSVCIWMYFRNSSVILAEKVSSIGKDWHRGCLKCAKCSKTLAAGSHAEVFLISKLSTVNEEKILHYVHHIIEMTSVIDQFICTLNCMCIILLRKKVFLLIVFVAIIL